MEVLGLELNYDSEIFGPQSMTFSCSRRRERKRGKEGGKEKEREREREGGEYKIVTIFFYDDKPPSLPKVIACFCFSPFDTESSVQHTVCTFKTIFGVL